MLISQRMSAQVATQLLGASEKRTESLPLRIIASLPFLAQGEGNNTLFLGEGYHEEVGGVYVDQDLDVPELPLAEAVDLLTNGLFADFSFVCPSDLSRAVAQLISPALKLGGFLGNADFPCNIAIADQSQSGKTHLMKIIAQVYGERSYVVINKSPRGVGSLDESMASALRSGKLFILCDNVRGQFDSQLLESALRGVNHVPVRVPHFGEIIVRTDRVLMQLTSNQADLPTDLTNRSIITSVRKPPKNHQPKLPWGEEFLVYINQHKALYLAAVHTIVREWVRRGKPHTNDRRHDFREWCQSMDWIVRNMFNLPPLLDGHWETQRHLSNKIWGWFRAVVLIVAREKKLGVALSASHLVDLGNLHSVHMPNIKEDASDEALNKHAGKLLKKVFPDDEDISFVDEFQVERSMEPDLRQGRDNKKYTVTLRPDDRTSRPVTTEPEPEPEVETTVIDNPPTANTSSAPAVPYVYVTQASQLEEVVTDLSKEGAIALDLETYFPDARLTKLGKRRKTAVDIVVNRFMSKIRLLQLYRADAEQVWLIDCKSIENLDPLREILEKRTIVGHGICTFDLPWLWAHYQIRASKIVDTLTISKLTTGGAPAAVIANDLKSLLERVGVNLPKDQGDSDWGVEELSPEQLNYAAGDVYFLHQVVSLHERLLEGDGMGAVWALEKELAPVIVDMSNQGMSFDVDSTGPIRADIDKRMAAAEKAAVDWFGIPNLNIASPRQLLEAFQAKGVRLTSVDEKNLSECESEGAKLVLEFRTIQNKESKFLESLVLLTRHGRIHGVFDPVGAKSGRIICKKPNLQQIPKRGLDENQFPIRTLFRAAPGKKLVVSDFSQMELVAIASLHEPIMLEALKNGVDLHVRTAELVLDKTDVSKDDRQLAKATNFGLCFGQAAEGFQEYAKLKYGIDLSFRQAESLRERFFDAYPGLRSWHEQARLDANEAVEARTVLGRRTWLGDSWWSRFAGLLNHHIQGSCSDVLKLALVELDQKLKGIASLCLCVHDEIILEADEKNAEQARKTLDEVMVSCFQCIFPDAPIAVESRIADAWQV